MASDLGDGDYLGAYRRFFVDFLDKVNPDDQLPIKTSGHDVTEGEIVGEIIYMTLQYLNQQLCPPSLQCYMVQLVIDEIKATCRKQPESCGFRQEEKTYAPLKLMQAVTGKVNEICQRYLENSRLALLPPPHSTPMPLATAFAIRNSRRKMEDRHVILHDLNTIFNIKDDSVASYYAVFDGHAGYQAAVFCATHLHQYLTESRHYPTDPERALRDAFLTTDARFIEKSTRQTLSSGTTAVCALILNRKLYVAWAGDSQAALAKRGVVTQLVNPHKPDRNDERERVEEMGGTVMHLGIWRVNGNLAVSRAIGDAQYKPYVTGDPEIRCITLDGNEDFLIIACDGLWDCVTEYEAATLVYRELYRDPYDYESSSQRLVEYAKGQGSIDNITVIVVFLATPRQIASRSAYGNPLLADVQMNNMEPDNRYLSNANGQYDVNSTFVKQQTAANNGSSDVTMDDEYGNYGNKSSNGKRHENGDEVADYDAEEDDDDLGPETDVDAVDDVSEPATTLADVSRQLFTEKPDPSEIYRNDECMDDDSPPSPNATKPNQQALIPEADNVGDSEDSEDEWNYYRIDPNKEKEEEAGAAGFSPVPKVKNEIADNAVSSSLEEHENKIELEEERESSKNRTDSSSDSESERETNTNVLIDTEISSDTKLELLNPAEATKIEVETEKFDEQEEKKIRDEEGSKENTEEDMDFQLNPDAAEFVPVSPTVTMPMRIDLDVPIAGSPLKQTPPMDDIKMPSRREFENEVRYRPHEIEEKNCTNGGQPLDDPEETAAGTIEKPAEETLAPVNLDDSEVSSTKAEFGDESSFLTTSEFHRTGVSTLDGSYTGSYGEFDESSIDPMTKSFGPGEFVALGNPVDLNAVHDLTDTDLEVEEGDDAPKADETEVKNCRNAEIDMELAKAQSTLNPLADDEAADNPLDSSDPVSFPPSPVSDLASNLESTEIPHDNVHGSSELLQMDPVAEEKQIDISNLDDPEINQPIAQSQQSDTPLEISDVTNVTTKLLEMDLEDRGSQDCGFEKCNEKWSADEKTTKIDALMDHFSPPVQQENIVETFSLPESLTFEATRIEESRDIAKLTESSNDICANEDLTSSQHSSVPDVAVLHNPLDLDTVMPSGITHENSVLEDDSFGSGCSGQKFNGSPEIGVSPLVENRFKNPFDEMIFSDSSLCVKPQEINVLTIVDEREDVKPAELAGPLEPEDPLETEAPPKPEALLEHKSPPEPEAPFVHVSPLKQECPLENESPLEPESLLENKDSLEQKSAGDFRKMGSTSPSTLSQSLEDFLGLEPKLEPEGVSDDLATNENVTDTRNDETKEARDTTEIIKIVSDEIENKITELVEDSESKTAEEKKKMMEKGSVIAASVAATIAAVGTAVAAKTTKAKPPGKVAPKTAAATKNAVNKSTPTSPTKPAGTSARTTTMPATKKSATGTSAARPNKLETVGKTGLSASPAGKSSATSAAKSTLSAARTTHNGRLGTNAPRAAKTSTTSVTTKTTALGEKKPTSNGEATKSSMTNRLSSTSARLPSSSSSSKPLVKSSTAGAARTITSTTTTTMTSASSRPKTASSTATSTSRLTSKATPTTGTIGTTTQRPKTAPPSGPTTLLAKSRLSSTSKTPITEKQIKDTANKQISSSRTGTTTTTANKTSRITGNSSTMASTRRSTATKTTSTSATTNNTAAPVIPPPIRKPGSMTRVSASKTTTTNGKTSSTKASSTATSKTKLVIENGVCTAEQKVTSATTVMTTTTMTTTSDSNEEDVPKKDISPVEPPTDNQLIITAD